MWFLHLLDIQGDCLTTKGSLLVQASGMIAAYEKKGQASLDFPVQQLESGWVRQVGQVRLT